MILHRAGDGQFYADVTLDGRIVTIRVDPRAAASRLRPEDLPPRAAPDDGGLIARDFVLEHLRLPASRFSVIDEPSIDAVIGADILAPHLVIEEHQTHLRLAPLPKGL